MAVPSRVWAQAFRTLQTSIQTVALQEQNASKAKEERSFAEERYKVGASTFLDVVTSRGSYEQALIEIGRAHV